MSSSQLEKTECVEDTTVDQVQFGTRATMHNRGTNKIMRLVRSKNWHGQPSMGSFPATIASDGTAKFVHMRDGQIGSMAAVQYDVLANKDGRPCSWILAWNSPSDNNKRHPNRVYVTCDTKYNIDNISWDQVLLNLEEAGQTSTARNAFSKTMADAKIDDKTPDTATLVANFAFTY